MENKLQREISIDADKCTGCRICQLWCSYIHNNKFLPFKAFIKISAYELSPKISFLEGCNNCGQCVKYCLYGALTFKGGSE